MLAHFRSLALIGLVALSACSLPVDGRPKPRDVSIPITGMTGNVCTATKMGPHLILTAEHCVVGEKLALRFVANQHMKAVLADDKKDHVLVSVVATLPPPYAKLNPHPLKDGDRVYAVGNMNGWEPLYREGYYMGIIRDPDESGKKVPWLMFDFSNFHGDSGSGVMDKHGHVVAMVTNGWISYAGILPVMLSRPISFTPAQLKAAGL